MQSETCRRKIDPLLVIFHRGATVKIKFHIYHHINIITQRQQYIYHQHIPLYLPTI